MPCRLRGTVVLAVLVLTAGVVVPAASQAPEDPLDGSEWVLWAFRRTSPIAGTLFTARFAQGRISGSGGCNAYVGWYEVRGDSIAVRDLAVGESLCEESPDLMEQERFLLDFLGRVRVIRFVGEQLRLHRPDGEALTFVPRTPIGS